MLLHWSILEPAGPGENLASIRFSSPVHVRSVRIFPTGARPFKLQEDVIAVTEPSSMYLDVYFNAIPASTDGASKQKQSNSLVPTSIAYQGGQVEFNVNTGSLEFTTRLMIIRGKFEKLSLAIYGEVVSGAQHSQSIYQPCQLPHVVRTALPDYLDPAHNCDPTELARSILSLIPGSPDLPLIVRLMFCLKPSNEDWEEEDFPYLYSNLEHNLDDMSLEKAVEMTVRPVSDTVNEQTLANFAVRLGESVLDYNDDEAYFLAKLLSQCAPQHPALIRYITQNVDLVKMYPTANLDRPTLLYLREAAASLYVSRHLNNRQTLDVILSIKDGPTYEEGARTAASRLYDRIKGWEVFEDSLLNTQAGFDVAASFVKEIATEENSFGIWLESMIMNNEILDRLLENPPSTRRPLTPIWKISHAVSHDDFIAFLRAIIGIAAVISVYAWSDSVPVEDCRERALAVLRLWQNVDGYREIVNHLMLMRQMTYRLECMLPLENDLPTQAGIDAEHILSELTLQPSSMLRADFQKVVQNLQAPLNYMTDDEVVNLKRISGLAKEGLPAAIRLLATKPESLSTVEKLKDIRVAIAIVIETLTEHPKGEESVLQTLWTEGHNSLSLYLIQHLSHASASLQTHFSLSIPSSKRQSEIATHFLVCEDLFELLSHLLPAYPVSSRYLGMLTRSIADIFICADSADMIYIQDSTLCTCAHAVRQQCIVTLSTLIVSPASPVRSAVPVLKALFAHASEPGNHDPVHHATQIFWLFDHTLPFGNAAVWGEELPDGQRQWVRRVMPAVLPALLEFYAQQEYENRVHLIRRCRDLDDSVIGLAEWLLLEEQKNLEKAISMVRGSSPKSAQQSVAHWRVMASLDVLDKLVTSMSSEWVLDTLLNDHENYGMLLINLRTLLECEFFYESAECLAKSLSVQVMGAEQELQVAVVSLLLRSVRCGRFEVLNATERMLHVPATLLSDERSRQELGGAFEQVAYAISSSQNVPSSLAVLLLWILQNKVPTENGLNVLCGLTEKSFGAVLDWVSYNLPGDENDALQAIRKRWVVAGEPRPAPTFIPSSYSVTLEFNQLIDLLSPPAPVPSTPTRRLPAQSAEMLGLITVSPPNALLRSPEVKGLTKTYANNDFRQLRQLSASKQNTSRLPSTHVDDFEQGAAPNMSTSSSPPSPLIFPAGLPPSLPMNPSFYQ